MKKKTGILILLSFIFIVLMSQIAFAAIDFAGILTDTGLSKLFLDIVDANGKLTENGLLYIRVILFLLVSAIIFGVSEWVFKDFAKGTRTIIAMAIGLISTITLPKTLLQLMITTYSTIFYLTLYGGLAIGGIYLAFTSFKGEERWHYFAKGLIFLVVWYITQNLVLNGIGASGALVGKANNEGLETLTSVMTLFSYILLFLGIYNLFKTFSGEHIRRGEKSLLRKADEFGNRDVKIPEPVKRGIKKQWRRIGYTNFTNEPRILENILNTIKNRSSFRDVGDIENQFESSNKITTRLNKLIEWSYKSLKHVKTEQSENAIKLIQEMEAVIQKVVKNIDESKKELQKTTPNYATAENSMKNAINEHKLLMRKEVQFVKLIEET